MSYALAFADEALDGWKELSFPLQEAALDEFDRIARTVRSKARWIQDLVIEREGFRYYLFFELRASASTQTLTVHRVGHAVIPL